MEIVELLTHIADALCPALELQRGRSAITGKVWLHSDGGEMPAELSTEDKDFLDELLPALPEITAKSDAASRAAFLRAYRAHRDRREWEPRVADFWDIDANRDARRSIRELHKERLSALFHAGELPFLTWDGKAAPYLTPRVYITVEDVRKYLKPLALLAEPATKRASETGARRRLNAQKSFSEQEVADMRAYEGKFGRKAMRERFGIGGARAIELLGKTQLGAKRQEKKDRAAQGSVFRHRLEPTEADKLLDD